MIQELSPQEQMVLEYRRQRLATVNEIGDHLDAKSSALLQAASIVTGIAGVVVIPPFATQPTAIYDFVALGFAFALFVGMILTALWAWSPSQFSVPGVVTWDDLFNRYLHVEVRACFDQILSDIEEAASLSKGRNERKAKAIRISGFLFACQIVGLFTLALVSA